MTMRFSCQANEWSALWASMAPRVVDRKIDRTLRQLLSSSRRSRSWSRKNRFVHRMTKFAAVVVAEYRNHCSHTENQMQQQ